MNLIEENLMKYFRVQNEAMLEARMNMLTVQKKGLTWEDEKNMGRLIADVVDRDKTPRNTLSAQKRKGR